VAYLVQVDPVAELAGFEQVSAQHGHAGQALVGQRRPDRGERIADVPAVADEDRHPCGARLALRQALDEHRDLAPHVRLVTHRLQAALVPKLLCTFPVSFRQRDPIEARWRRMIPATKIRAWRDNGSAARWRSTEAPGHDKGRFGRLPHLPGLLRYRRRHAAASPDRDEPITIRMKGSLLSLSS
jgi:hypothetical protein